MGVLAGESKHYGREFAPSLRSRAIRLQTSNQRCWSHSHYPYHAPSESLTLAWLPVQFIAFFIAWTLPSPPPPVPSKASDYVAVSPDGKGDADSHPHTVAPADATLWIPEEERDIIRP
jgi:hypothetical protein